MRPIKLTMSAFANYADVQIIDFTELQNRNIFLITGNTGAGKTTIFDAISFVLFNNSSGNSRGVDSLRSDYADGSIETFVELEFELKGELYKIRRSPEQKLNMKKGEGITKRASSASFEIPSLERPVTGTTAVTKKLIEVLGVTSDQFRQIVMLPQGEFMKFLKASSSDKKDIFRGIFGTAQFHKVQEKLKDRSMGLKKELNDFISKRDVHVKNIKSDEYSTLYINASKDDYDIDKILELTKELIKSDLSNARALVEDLESSKKKSKELNDKKINLENDRKIITSYNDNKKMYKEKLSSSGVVEEHKIKSMNGKKAQKVKIIDDNRLKAIASRDNKKLELESCIELNKKICVTLEDTKIKFDVEKSREEVKTFILLELENLLKQEQRVKDYDSKKVELLKKVLEYSTISKTIELSQESLAKEEELENQLKQFIDEANYMRIEENEIEGKGKQKKLQIEQLNSLKQKFKQVQDKRRIHKDKSKEFIKTEVTFNKAKDKFEKSEEIFKKSLAGILAYELKDGEPCTVCGSKEHPVKAIKPEEAPTELQLKELKSDMEDKKIKYDNDLNDLTILKSDIDYTYNSATNDAVISFADLLSNDFDKLSEAQKDQNILEISEKLNSEIKDFAKRYKELKAKTSLIDSKNKELKICSRSIVDFKSDIEKNKKNKDNIFKLKTSLEEQVNIIEQEIPENLRSLDLLNAKKIELTLNLNNMIKDYEKAEKNYKKASDDYTENNKAIELSQKDLKEKEMEVSKLESDFNDELLAQGFDLNIYESYKISDEMIEKIDKRIEGYNKELNIITGAYNASKVHYNELAINDMNDIDLRLDEIAQNIKDIQMQEKKLQNEINSCSNRASINKDIILSVEAINSKVKDKEIVYKDVEYLAKVSRGEGGNEKKIEFETYILTSYFDEIIVFANIRLGKMTNGRFELRRAEETKGGGRKGLELSVVDNNTGKERSINSLSGGETFKAALAIALALAEVIQNSSGGISIETMFIDEGFGTLDPASLDTAINCLLDLQSGGRLVGVISHVQELKERIDARLEVKIRDDNKGSKAEFIAE